LALFTTFYLIFKGPKMNSKKLSSSALRNLALLACCAAAPTCIYAADAFAPTGAKGSLTVDYLYESTGKKSSEGMYDPYTWRVKREFHLATTVVAQAGTALPSMQALDATQTTALQNKQAKAQSAATQMAPMVGDIEKIMAKCGGDEACITSAVQKYGMQGGPAINAAMGAQKDVSEVSKQGNPRYQRWQSTAQSGSYLIDETADLSVTDPICASRPRHRCTRNEVRKGSGEIALPAEAKKNPQALSGASALEFDTEKNTLTVVLPAPLLPLPYTETITTDEPEGTHDTPTPKGPQQRSFLFRAMHKEGGDWSKPLTITLKGGKRDQSGEYAVNVKGDFGNGGKLTVRWNFKMQ
jgi:hypothetical protein